MQLSERLFRASGACVRILVVGDVMLDRYWFGDVSRISPEAPVPVVKVERSEERPGGAANVARNAAALGAKVSLLALVGNDEPGASLKRLMTEGGIDASLHVDDAVMGGLRTDLSFTLFLCDPETYDGGALVIEDTLEARSIKLQAGDMILYPSTTLHRVEPVTRGERLAVVGWVQSQIRNGEQREILFDLDQSVQHIAPSFAPDDQRLVQLTGVYHNLLRRWADA